VAENLGRLGLIFKFKILARLLLIRKKFYAKFGRSSERAKMMINLGGGLNFRPYWKILDYISPFYPFAERYVDFNIDLFENPRFPFEDDSIDLLYSAHTLEHIPQEFCQNIFNEIYRCLKPGGAVRLNMPDYDIMRVAVETNDTERFEPQTSRGLGLEEAVVEQIATAMLDDVKPDEIVDDYHKMNPTDFADYYTGRASRHVQKENGGFHINWFTDEKLSQMLRDGGFETVYRSGPQGSKFAELTGEGGWLATGDNFELKRMLGMDTTHPHLSLFVEAVK